MFDLLTNHRSLLRALLILMLLSTGCGTIHRRNPPPQELSSLAQLPGYVDIRDWGDAHSAVLQKSIERALQQEAAHTGRNLPALANHPVTILAMSGGGMNGAFGAGFLCGWTEHGSRPEFDLVTGISAGALLAPFAFMGTNYDAALRQVYEQLGPNAIFRKKGFLSLLREDSIYDTTPLRRTIERLVTSELLAQIAQEHAKGRRLWVGTANLDAHRPVIWDLGAVAASGRADAPELFRNILLASSAIPGAFPPVYLRVEAGGRQFDELHVDGGVGFQVFAYGVVLNLDEKLRRRNDEQPPRPAKLFVIRNGELQTHFKPVEARLFPIVMSSLNMLTYRQSIGDFYRMFAYAGRDQVDFNLAGIPTDYQPLAKDAFNPQEMKRLFEIGQRAAREGYPWLKAPPGYEDSH